MEPNRSSTATPPTGGCTFAEDPERASPQARIIWRAERDPETIRVTADPSDAMDPDRIDPAVLAQWLTMAIDAVDVEHVVLSDGWHRIKLDIVQGSLSRGGPVHLHYQITGTVTAQAKLLPLRRFLHLYRHGVFTPALYPSVGGIAYALAVLRVHDATLAGASQREIAIALFGSERVFNDWGSDSESLRSRIRRLVSNARRMADGDFRTLLKDGRLA